MTAKADDPTIEAITQLYVARGVGVDEPAHWIPEKDAEGVWSRLRVTFIRDGASFTVPLSEPFRERLREAERDGAQRALTKRMERGLPVS